MKYLGIIHLCFVLLFAVSSVSAQELDGHYYPFAYPHEQLPEIDIDSTLFNLPAYDDLSLFDQLTQYGLSSVRFARRGVSDRIVELDGVQIDQYSSYALRRLLRTDTRTDGMEQSDVFGAFVGSQSFRTANSFGLRRTAVTANVTDRNKLFTVRFYDARPLGHDERWSYALSLSGDGGRDLRVGGVFTQRIEAAALISHRWNEGNLSMVAMVSPSQRGVRTATTNEVYELTGDNLYNPSWGVHDGRERNSRVRRELLPSVSVSLRHKQWFATLYARAGERSISSLNWYDARIPTPDNYRQLPSYFDSEQVRTEIERVWRERDPRYTQIDWAELYARNAMTDGRSVYIVEDRVEAPREVHAVAGGEFTVARNTTVRAKATADLVTTENFKRLRDPLGGEYIIDIDQYLVDDERFGTSLLNDLRNPDRRIEAGDRFGYDYRLTENRFGASVELDYRDNRMLFGAGARVAAVSAWRTGLFEKQLFAGADSYGGSERVRGVEAAAKLSYTYLFSARHRLSMSAAVARRKQPIEPLLLQPAYNNALADVEQNATNLDGEIAYLYRASGLSLNVKGFVRIERGAVQTMRFFDDVTYNYVDAVVSGIDRHRYGAELSAQVALSPRFDLSTALTAGSYRYASNPSVSLFTDADNRTIVEDAPSYMSGLHTAETPTFAAVARLSYSEPFGWRVEIEAAYAAGRYAAPTPIRRMTRVTDLATSPEEFEQMTSQCRLGDALTVGVAAMRSWKIGGVPSRLTTMVSVRNLLCDRDIVYSAYEPSRVVRAGSGVNIHYRAMPERYTYAYPLSFNVSFTYKFR